MQTKRNYLKYYKYTVLFFLAAAFFLLVTVSSCMDLGDKTYEELEPDDLPANPTYTVDIAPLMDLYCNKCHSYNDYFAVRYNWESIVLTGIDEKTMPPGGKERISPRDEAIILRWKNNGFQFK